MGLDGGSCSTSNSPVTMNGYASSALALSGVRLWAVRDQLVTADVAPAAIGPVYNAATITTRALGFSGAGGPMGVNATDVFKIGDDAGIEWTRTFDSVSAPVASASTIFVRNTLSDGGSELVAVTTTGIATRHRSSRGLSASGAIGADNRVYFPGQGSLTVATAAGIEWEGAVPTMPAVAVSPALDCTRDDAGTRLTGRPGTLYLLSGSPVELVALIVDARGISTTSAWPMNNHDPRRTNNAQTALTDFSCP
jgi:hypothetical protein